MSTTTPLQTPTIELQPCCPLVHVSLTACVLCRYGHVSLFRSLLVHFARVNRCLCPSPQSDLFFTSMPEKSGVAYPIGLPTLPEARRFASAPLLIAGQVLGTLAILREKLSPLFALGTLLCSAGAARRLLVSSPTAPSMMAWYLTGSVIREANRNQSAHATAARKLTSASRAAAGVHSPVTRLALLEVSAPLAAKLLTEVLFGRSPQHCARFVLTGSSLCALCGCAFMWLRAAQQQLMI